jgi:hypothetical protein
MKWLSMKKYLPPYGQRVLLYIDNIENCPKYAVGYRETDDTFYFNEGPTDIDCLEDDLVTHWMHLPPSPEIDKELNNDPE